MLPFPHPKMQEELFCEEFKGRFMCKAMLHDVLLFVKIEYV